MTSNVIPLTAHRRNHEHTCTCACDSTVGFTCYPHRLVDLIARIEDLKADVDWIQVVDMGTFRRLTTDVLDVLTGITDECLPDERRAR